MRSHVHCCLKERVPSPGENRTYRRRPARGRACVRRRTFLGPTLAGLASLLGSQSSRAVDASEYLLLPTVTLGEREVDFHSGIGSSGPMTPQENDYGVGLGIGLTQHWFSELAIRYRSKAGSGTAPRELEWENIVQMAELGEWPVDVGMAFLIEKPNDYQEGVSAVAGPMLQKEIRNFQINFNALFGRYFGSTESHPTEIVYQSQLKYRYSQPFEFGIQAFGNMGSRTQSWAGYPEQTHRIGPVVLGRFPLLREQSISYNAAFLFGTTAHSPDRTIRLQIEYEF